MEYMEELGSGFHVTLSLKKQENKKMENVSFRILRTYRTFAHHDKILLLL